MASQGNLFDENSQVAEGECEADIPEGARGEDEDYGKQEANDYNPKTKRTIKFQPGELGVIIDHLEKNLQNLTGHIKSNEYR